MFCKRKVVIIFLVNNLGIVINKNIDLLKIEENLLQIYFSSVMNNTDKKVGNWRIRNKTSHNSFNHTRRGDHNEITLGKLKPAYVSKRKPEDFIEKKKEASDKIYGELVDDFWSKTTIQGVSQIGTRKSYTWRFIWLFVALSGAGMAMYQSRDVLQDYYGKSTIQKMSFKSKDAPFPAVSICKTVKVKSIVSDTSSSSDETQDHDLWINDTYEPRDSLNYIQKCKFGTHSCNLTNEEYIFPWSNPKYGSCFTFNAGFNSVKSIDIAAVLNLVIDMNEPPESSELSDFTIIVIHQSQTPPILYSAQYNVINPRDLITIKLKARELIKLKGSTDCVLPDAKEAVRSNIFYSKETPYIFTTLACQKSCEIKRRKYRFDCLDPSSVINATGDIVEKKQKYCNYTEVTYDIDQDYKRPCMCALPCRETLLDNTLTTSTTFCKNSNENETLSCAVIKISYGNVPYEIIEEKRKYSDADFWGIIGGNVGLWVGICIISLLEVIELAFNVAFVLFKNRISCCRRGKKVIVRLPRMRRYPMYNLEKDRFSYYSVDVTKKKFANA